MEKYKTASDSTIVRMMEEEFVRDVLQKCTFRKCNGSRQVSKFAYKALEYHISELTALKNALLEDRENGIVRHILAWFGLKLNQANDKRLSAKMNAKQGIHQLIDDNLNKPLNNAEYKEFCQKIELLYLEAFPCQTVIHHRKDRTIGTATLKKILTEYDVLVERSKKGTHIFKRQRSDE